MKTSVIRHRVADFLKTHAPFDALAEPDLLDLAGSGRVKFHESDEYILQQGDAKGAVLWIIQQGRVELMEGRPSGDRLRDVLGEGDLLGLTGSPAEELASAPPELPPMSSFMESPPRRLKPSCHGIPR